MITVYSLFLQGMCSIFALNEKSNKISGSKLVKSKLLFRVFMVLHWSEDLCSSSVDWYTTTLLHGVVMVYSTDNLISQDEIYLFADLCIPYGTF